MPARSGAMTRLSLSLTNESRHCPNQPHTTHIHYARLGGSPACETPTVTKVSEKPLMATASTSGASTIVTSATISGEWGSLCASHLSFCRQLAAAVLHVPCVVTP